MPPAVQGAPATDSSMPAISSDAAASTAASAALDGMLSPQCNCDSIVRNRVTDILIYVLLLLLLLLSVRAVATDCIVFVRVFFSVSTITHEPLHLA